MLEFMDCPYNLQGFFMNFGDMLVKEGEPEIAREIYQTAMDHPDFETWPYKEYLIRRIENAEQQLEKNRIILDELNNVRK